MLPELSNSRTVYRFPSEGVSTEANSAFVEIFSVSPSTLRTASGESVCSPIFPIIKSFSLMLSRALLKSPASATASFEIVLISPMSAMASAENDPLLSVSGSSVSSSCFSSTTSAASSIIVSVTLSSSVMSSSSNPSAASSSTNSSFADSSSSSSSLKKNTFYAFLLFRHFRF